MRSTIVLTKSYDAPAICEKEIFRYAGCREVTAEVSALLSECLAEASGKLTYRVCYRVMPVAVRDGTCDFGLFSLESKNLAQNLSGCEKVIVFAATVGVGMDRLIAKYGRISPVKALLFQAIGAERIEALCDAFCEDMETEYRVGLKPRFSPGYGDLPLGTQNDIFAVLDCPKRIGLSLNSSLLMSPSKSVTAFVGLTQQNVPCAETKCESCEKKDCSFRGEL